MDNKTKTQKEIKAIVYKSDGKKGSEISLPGIVFGAKWNPDLLHQVIVSMQSNARANTAHTKDRSEVAGTGKKPWRQKGTGRARHGSRRSPIWVGGGVTFGPRNERNYDKKINKKSRASALAIALTRKLSDGQIAFVDGIKFEKPSVKETLPILAGFAALPGFETVNTKKPNNLLIITPNKDEVIEKSFRNLDHVRLLDVHDLNPVHIAQHRYIVFVNQGDSIEFLTSRFDNKNK